MASKSRQWAAKLDYPEEYGLVPENECNGIGPKNFGWLTNDLICGINIRESGKIHDAYWFLKMKHLGNKKFLKNMFTQIAEDSSFFRRTGARSMAYVYYGLVKIGGPIFYDR